MQSSTDNLEPVSLNLVENIEKGPASARRIDGNFGPFLAQIDVHENVGMRFCFLRIPAGKDRTPIRLPQIINVESVTQSSEFGFVLRASVENLVRTVWLPSAPMRAHCDELGRLSGSNSCSYRWVVGSTVELEITDLPENDDVFLPLVIIDDPDEILLNEIVSLDNIERKLYRKSDWFFAHNPTDIWNYLISGNIYDPRTHRNIGKRFKCQQCAYAWWTYFEYLHSVTGKRIHSGIRDEIALSVLLDMDIEGAWRHGFWTNEPETHARFQLDGLHLLLSQYEKSKEPIWLDGANKGFSFVKNVLMDKLDDGSVWFLHDTIRNSERQKYKSRLFGKSQGNTLCINTHVQALTVLQRLAKFNPEEEDYKNLLNRGLKSLRRILECRSGEAFYRILIPWIMTHKTRPKSRAVYKRILSRFERKNLPKLYWWGRQRYPRFVQPGGFIERDLNVATASDIYHVTNIKDLLTLYIQMPLPWLLPYIHNGVNFLRDFLNKEGMCNAVKRSPYYIEVADILFMYHELFGGVTLEDVERAQKAIYAETKGCSLDFFTSALVRGGSCCADSD